MANPLVEPINDNPEPKKKGILDYLKQFAEFNNRR